MNLSLEQISLLVQLNRKTPKTVAAIQALSELHGFDSRGRDIPAMKAHIDALVSLGLVRRVGPALYQISEDGYSALRRAETVLDELHSHVVGALTYIKMKGIAP